jgi:hypothetical protein
LKTQDHKEKIASNPRLTPDKKPSATQTLPFYLNMKYNALSGNFFILVQFQHSA